MFRQNKRATDVHDILGFRIVVSPGSPPPRVHAASTTGKPGTTSPEEGSVSIASKSPKELTQLFEQISGADEFK